MAGQSQLFSIGNYVMCSWYQIQCLFHPSIKPSIYIRLFISGWLYDDLQSYRIPFLLAGCCMTFSALLLIVPWRRWSAHEKEANTFDQTLHIKCVHVDVNVLATWHLTTLNVNIDKYSFAITSIGKWIMQPVPLQILAPMRLCDLASPRVKCRLLKLYFGYIYTSRCMINRISGLKQLWLQVNGHA